MNRLHFRNIISHIITSHICDMRDIFSRNVIVLFNYINVFNYFPRKKISVLVWIFRLFYKVKIHLFYILKVKFNIINAIIVNRYASLYFFFYSCPIFNFYFNRKWHYILYKKINTTMYYFNAIFRIGAIFKYREVKINKIFIYYRIVLYRRFPNMRFYSCTMQRRFPFFYFLNCVSLLYSCDICQITTAKRHGTSNHGTHQCCPCIWGQSQRHCDGYHIAACYQQQSEGMERCNGCVPHAHHAAYGTVFRQAPMVAA